MRGATEFNGALVGWDTSKVANLNNVFEDADAFNQQLVQDTSSVKTFCTHFKDATAFNSELVWDTRR